MYYFINRFLPGIRVVLWGTTTLLSCNHPHATRMNELATHGLGANMHQRDDNGVTALHMAVRRGDATIVHTLLNQLPESNRMALIHQEINGTTALHIAAERGYTAMVNTLLHGGADIHQSNNTGETVLHYAAQSGNEAIVNTLLRGGAHVHQRNSGGENALHYAAEKGHAAIVNILLNLVPEEDRVALIQQRDSKGATALHIAALNGQEVIANALLDGGADIHQRNSAGEDASHMAVRSRHIGVTGVFLASLVRGGEEMPEYMLQHVPSTDMRNLLETLLKNVRLDPGVSESIAEAFIRLYYNE